MLTLNLPVFKDLIKQRPEYDEEEDIGERKRIENQFYKICRAESPRELEGLSSLDFLDILQQADGIMGGYDKNSVIRSDALAAVKRLHAVPRRRLL